MDSRHLLSFLHSNPNHSEAGGGGGQFPHHPPQRAGPGSRQGSLSWATPCSSHIGEPGTRLSGPPSHRSRDGPDGVLQHSAPCGPRSWGLAAGLAHGRGDPGRIPGGAGGRGTRRGAGTPAQPPRPTVRPADHLQGLREGRAHEAGAQPLHNGGKAGGGTPQPRPASAPPTKLRCGAGGEQSKFPAPASLWRCHGSLPARPAAGALRGP